MTAAQNHKGEKLAVGSATDVGKRSNQEDRFAVQEFQTADGRQALLALVADGIGGHNTGEVASEMAKNAIPLHISAKAPTVSQIAVTLRTALQEASHDIYEASLADDSRNGMGTTCTALVIVDRQLYLAHAGDSRAYLLRGQELRQLSIDHTWAEDAIRAGRSPEEIRTHPNRGVIKRYLGIDPSVEIDTRFRVNGDVLGDAVVEPLRLEAGDTLMLCSDGVADVLESAQIAQLMQSGEPPQAAKNIIAGALRAGASDNVTTVVLRVPGGKAMGKKVPIWAGGAALLGVVAVGAIIVPLVLKPGGSAAPAVAATQIPAGAPTAVQVAAAPRTPGTGGLVSATSAAGAPSEPGQAAGGAAATGSEPTLMPTHTPPPTATTVPTAAPTATEAPTAVPTMTSVAATAQQPATGTSVELLDPGPNATLKGSVTFRWKAAPGYSLPVGGQYELAFWKPGQDPVRNAMSPVGAMYATSVNVDLAAADVQQSELGSLIEPGTLYWGVFLYDLVNGRVSLLSEARTFVFERQGDKSGSSGSSGGGAR